MSDAQIEATEHELKISVRLKGKLAEQVIKRTEQDGIYDNKGEYIRDLVRKDMKAEPTLDDHLNEIWKQIHPGSIADESEFKPVSIKEIQKRGRQKAGLINVPK